MNKEKELLFSVTIDDCETQTFKAGGKGGQHQNKTESGVRVIHRKSGAVGEARDCRSQRDNKINAFIRMVHTDEFKKWHRIESAKYLGQLIDIDKVVDKQMDINNLKIEVFKDNKWVNYNE